MTTTTQAVASAASSDFTALATNLAVLVSFIAAAIVGVRKGLKSHAEANRPLQPSEAKVVAATLMENITLSEWSMTNRETREAVLKLCHAVTAMTDEMKELKHVIQLDMATRR